MVNAWNTELLLTRIELDLAQARLEKASDLDDQEGVAKAAARVKMIVERFDELVPESIDREIDATWTQFETTRQRALLADLYYRATTQYAVAFHRFREPGKTEERALSVVRALGWVSKGRHRLPRLEILYFYNRLTTEENTVGWFDWHASDLALHGHGYAGMIRCAQKVKDQPVSPGTAIALLRGWYGITSDEACLRLLQRGRVEARAIASHGSDLLAARIAATRLPQSR